MAGFSFNDLKKSQGNLEKLNAAAKALNKNNYAKDERLWKPVVDKGGEGSAVIRFLPGPGEEIPFVKKYSYGFKNERTGQYYIENSPTTLDLPDPVAEYNSAMWNSGEDGKEVARKQKRRLSYISNIIVVKHKARPEDEGKVFLFEYGAKIFAKLQDKMNPSDEDDVAFNPFDMWEGANFRLKVKKVANFSNYDDSSFENPSMVDKSDEKMEAIWKQTHSLQAEIAPDKFKSYAELEKRFLKVIGVETSSNENREEPVREAASAPSTAARFEAKKEAEPVKTVSSSSEDDGDIDWLKDLTA